MGRPGAACVSKNYKANALAHTSVRSHNYMVREYTAPVGCTITDQKLLGGQRNAQYIETIQTGRRRMWLLYVSIHVVAMMLVSLVFRRGLCDLLPGAILPFYIVHRVGHPFCRVALYKLTLR